MVFASQTGNAEDVAELLGAEAALRHFSPRVVSSEACDLGTLAGARLLVCVVATAGQVRPAQRVRPPSLCLCLRQRTQGDPPDSFVRLWRSLLRKSLPPTALAHCRCAVFGLGDSGYPKFNVMAKKLDRRLEALGAAKLVPLGLGDDQARGCEGRGAPFRLPS